MLIKQQLPDHLIAFEGALYDTRREGWSGRPVRAPYRQHYRTICDTLQLRATLRAGACVFPGGYGLALVETTTGDTLCFDCVRRHYADHARNIADRRGFPYRAESREPYMLLSSSETEEHTEHCDDCGALLWEGGEDE